MNKWFARGSRLHFCSVILIAAVFVLCLSTNSSRAEFYFGGAIGGNFPLDFSDVELNSINNPPIDLSLENSLAYGGKAGYFFSSLKWLGVEVEAFNTNPNIKQQVIVVNGVPINISGINLAVTTAAVNLVARYPGKRFEPYIGAGPGVFIARISQGGVNSETAVVPGVNVIGGGRVYLTDWLALFTEYKFNYAKFDFDNGAIGFQGTYIANHVHGGISIHFK